MFRRAALVLVCGSAVFLVPWTIYLFLTLPVTVDASSWRLSWVGFDTLLACCLAAAAWLGWRRNRTGIPVLGLAAGLLCCDAWFDVTLDWDAPDHWTSVAMALVVELPLAGFLLWRARVLVSGGMPRRPMTVADIELSTDPRYVGLGDALTTHGPAEVGALAARLSLDTAEVAGMLERLAAAGRVRRGGDGRWHPVSLTLQEPDLAALSEPDRARLRAFYDAKFDNEVRLFAWAARRREDFGSWGRGHRARAHLTRTELAAFNAEYEELLNRYCLLRSEPAQGTRPVAVRWYAFPFPEQAVLDSDTA